MSQRFIPSGVELPAGLEHERFRLRPITIHDAQARLVRRHDGEVERLPDEAGAAARAWVEAEWPFERVAYPGRVEPWDEYHALPDVEA